MCDSLASNFKIKLASECKVEGAEGLVAFEKSDEGGMRPLFSFVPPTGGMFVWARFYFRSFPGFERLRANERCVDPEAAFETELWALLAKALVGSKRYEEIRRADVVKVLLTPGSYYEPWQGRDKKTTSTRGGEKGVGNFRLAFSMTTVRTFKR